MPALNSLLQQKLQDLEKTQQKRAPMAVVRKPGGYVEVAGRQLLSFSCNDYLGLTHHLEVIAAAKEALVRYGAGAGASRLISGSHPFYEELESALSEHKKTEAACVFGSGYLANLGTIPALVGAGDLIVADKLSHACLLDAAKLSGAKLIRFAHNDMKHCKDLLEKYRADYRNCLLVTETIFSMDGDMAPLAELNALAAQYDSWLLTDDAHGLYVAAETPHQSHIQVGTLSKALASYGGYVCGSAQLIDMIKSSARSLIYSTALPPATLAASLAALRVVAAQPELAQTALASARYFAKQMGLSQAQSCIVPLIVGSSEQALNLSKALEENGFYVKAIRPPTVPENTARLRFTFSAYHTQDQIDALVAALKGAL